jgi:hypothetical protein
LGAFKARLDASHQRGGVNVARHGMRVNHLLYFHGVLLVVASDACDKNLIGEGLYRTACHITITA